jgi:hypothetical protein
MATFTKIASVTVGSGGSTLVQFTSIPSTYTDLQLLVSIRYGTNSNQTQSIGLYFNGDGFPASASGRVLNGNGSTTSSYTSSGFNDAGIMNDTSTTANTFSSHSIYIPNYAGSNFKSLSIDSVTENNATLARANTIAGLYSSTSAINAIKVDTGGTALQHSTFTLYGIKNS